MPGPGKGHEKLLVSREANHNQEVTANPKKGEKKFGCQKADKKSA